MPHQQFVYTRLFHLHMTRSNAAPFPQRSPPEAFRPQQLTVVWNLLLQADSEGPPFIFDTASCSCKHVLDTTPPRSNACNLKRWPPYELHHIRAALATTTQGGRCIDRRAY